MARKAAIRFPDFSIVHRKDRNGYEGWYGGKAEAFRKTAEKVDAFFQKKYGQAGVLMEGFKEHQTETVPVAKAPKATKPKAEPKAKEPKAPKVLELDPETFEAEDRLDASDLAVLL